MKNHKIGETLGIKMNNTTQEEKKKLLLNYIRELKLNVGIIHSLSERGVKSSDIPGLSEKAIKDPCMVTNPRVSNKKDIEVVYAEAL